MVSVSISLSQQRAELARAARAHKRQGSEESRARLEELRRDYAQAKILDYVERVVAKAPAFSPAQRDTVMAAFAGFAPNGGAL